MMHEHARRSQASRPRRMKALLFAIGLALSLVSETTHAQRQAKVTEEQIIEMLAAMTDRRIVQIVESTCFAGSMDTSQQLRLTARGASEVLISALTAKRCEQGPGSSASTEASRASAPIRTVLSINSDTPQEWVRLDGVSVGRTPLNLVIDATTALRLSIGEEGRRIDTTLSDLRSYDSLRMDVRTIVQQGKPAPSMAQLTLEMGSHLPEVPERPVVPSAPRPPRAMHSFLLGIIAGAGAVTPTLEYCGERAVSPSPWGGFVGETYYAPGQVVQSIKQKCTGVVAGSAAVGSAVLLHALRVKLHAGSKARYDSRLTGYQAEKARREFIEQRRTHLLDSAMTSRMADAARRTVTRSVSVVSVPRRP